MFKKVKQKLEQSKVDSFRYALKKYGLQGLQLTENEEGILKSLNISQKAYLESSLGLLNEGEPALLNPLNFGEDSVKWLIAQFGKYTAKEIFNTLQLLKQNQLIKLSIFEPFSELLSSFSDQTAGEAFLFIFRRLVDDRLYLTSDANVQSTFNILSALKGQDAALPLLKDIFLLRAKDIQISLYVRNYFATLVSIDNIDALKATVNIITLLNKSEALINNFLDSTKILTYFTLAQARQPGVMRSQEELQGYSQVFSVLDQNNLLVENNIAEIQRLGVDPKGLYVPIMQLAEKGELTQRNLEQELTSIKNEAVSLGENRVHQTNRSTFRNPIHSAGLFTTDASRNENAHALTESAEENPPPAYNEAVGSSKNQYTKR